MKMKLYQVLIILISSILIIEIAYSEERWQLIDNPQTPFEGTYNYLIYDIQCIDSIDCIALSKYNDFEPGFDGDEFGYKILWCDGSEGINNWKTLKYEYEQFFESGGFADRVVYDMLWIHYISRDYLYIECFNGLIRKNTERINPYDTLHLKNIQIIPEYRLKHDHVRFEFFEMADSINGLLSYIISADSTFICRTTDGWETWDEYLLQNQLTEEQNVNGEYIHNLTSIDKRTFYGNYNLTRGFNIGQTGFCKSTDGGLTWEFDSLFKFSDYLFRDILFLNKYDGFICGKKHFEYPDNPTDYYLDMILKTTDGGETWRTVLLDSLNPGQGLSSIKFANDKLGMAFGGGGKMWKTTDGGETWKNISAEFVEDFKKARNGKVPANPRTEGTFAGTMPVIGLLSSDIWYLSDDVTSILDFSHDNQFRVYPNPAKSVITITNLEPGMEYKIFNTLGIEVLSGIYNENINVANLVSGIYFIQLPSTGETLKFAKD